MTTADAQDPEFRFLPGDALRAGRTAPLPPVTRVSASVGEGRRLSGLSFDAPAAPRIVALHGAGLNAHSFDPFLLALGAPALALDLPGHGRSDWRADGDYRPDHLADDVATALEALAPEPVVLLGHSLGGLTAALVAAAQPERVRALVIVDITPGLSPARDAGVVTEFIRGQRSFADVAEAVDRAIAFGIGSDRAALTRGVTLNTRTRADGRLEWTHHLAHLDAPATGADPAGEDPQPYAPIWASLQTVTAPILLVRASSGMVSDALAEEWREQLPEATIREVSGPHNLHEAAPVALAEAVASLLATAPDRT